MSTEPTSNPHKDEDLITKGGVTLTYAQWMAIKAEIDIDAFHMKSRGVMFTAPTWPGHKETIVNVCIGSRTDGWFIWMDGEDAVDLSEAIIGDNYRADNHVASVDEIRRVAESLAVTKSKLEEWLHYNATKPQPANPYLAWGTGRPT